MDTKELVTPGGHKVVYREYLSGRERREIQNVFVEGMEIDPSTAAPKKIDASLINKAQDKSIEMMVVSVDGKTEKVLDLVLDLPSKDFDSVIQALNALETPKKK